jgi:hypothetical protein
MFQTTTKGKTMALDLSAAIAARRCSESPRLEEQTRPRYSKATTERLANDLELLAEERASLGDAREAGVYRARAAAVRAGSPDPGWN